MLFSSTTYAVMNAITAIIFWFLVIKDNKDDRVLYIFRFIAATCFTMAAIFWYLQ